MPKPQPSTETVETPETPVEEEVAPESTDAPEGQEEGTENSPAEGTEESGLDLDGAKAALAKTRKSEAAMRTRLREIEKQLETTKTPEEVEALLDGLRAANAAEAHTLLVENVALKHGLPDDLAGALKGTTREELEAHAKTLAKYAPSQEDDEDPALGGGLSGKSTQGSSDLDQMRAYMKKAVNGVNIRRG